jgi:hypothetical protein
LLGAVLEGQVARTLIGPQVGLGATGVVVVTGGGVVVGRVVGGVVVGAGVVGGVVVGAAEDGVGV